MAKSPAIRTKRLTIVPFNEKHLNEKYVAWLNDKELMRYSEQRHREHNIEECRSYLKSFDGTPNYFWAIEENEQGFGHIGNITAFVDENNGVVDVGIMIGAREAHGRRYGIEAWMAVCDYLFKNLPIRKLTAGTMSINIPMLKIMKRAGMIDDGIRKKHFLSEGKEVDIIHMALFREDWESSNSFPK
jgi:RimJ/RimL family protein N-acetyltransferase